MSRAAIRRDEKGIITMMRKLTIPVLVILCVAVLGGVIALIISYNWCPFGYSLQLTRKTGEPAVRIHRGVVVQNGLAGAWNEPTKKS